jgi:hypothetical protein
MKHKQVLHLAISLFILFGLTSISLGQETRATIVGLVSDPNGAVVPGASIILTNIETNVSTKTTSNNDGLYEIPLLLPGQYTVTAEAPGFKKHIRQGVILSVGSRVEVNVQLDIGQPIESVIINDESPLLETTTGSTGQVIDNRRVTELPALFNNAMILSAVVPGMQSTGGILHSDPRSHGSGSNYTSHGAVGGNEWSLDGTPNQGLGRRNGYMPFTDAVEELKIVTNNFDASQGHSTGAFVTMLSKSGGNEYHGALTGTYQNQRWNATRREDNANYWGGIRAAEAAGNLERARLLRSDQVQNAGRTYTYGASVGGPIKLPRFGEGGPALIDGKDKLFFFFSLSGLDQLSVTGLSHRRYTVPTEAMRRGDFSHLLRLPRSDASTLFQLYDPTTTRLVGTRYVRDPLPGNVIPANLIRNPFIKMYERFYPLPNNPPLFVTPEGYNNFFGYSPGGFPYRAIQNRIDYVATPKDKFFGRWSHFTTRELGEDWSYVTVPGFHNINKLRESFGFGLDYVRTINQTTVLNVSAAYNRYSESLGNMSEIKRNYKPSDIGLPAYMDEKAGAFHHLPIVNFTGVSNSQPGGYKSVSSGFNEPVNGRVATLKADLTKLVNKHSFRMGWEGRLYQEYQIFHGNTSGSFNFRNTFLSRDSATTNQSSMLEWAAFLMGLPSEVSVETRGDFFTSTPYQAVYIQDNFRATKNLTLEFGLRYEYEGSVRERQNRGIRDFNFNAMLPFSDAVQRAYARSPIAELPASQFLVRGGSNYLGVGGTPETLTNPTHNFMPRFGFAYQINEKTVIRGGYGVYYDTFSTVTIGEPGFSQQGYSATTTRTFTNDDVHTELLSGRVFADPFPIRPDGTRFNSIVGNAFGLSAVAGRSLSYVDPNFKPARQQRWRLGVERQLGSDMVVSIAYEGSVARDIGLNLNMNSLPEKYWASGNARNRTIEDSLRAQVTNPFRISTNPEFQRAVDPKLLIELGSLATFSGDRIERHRLLRPYPHLTGLTQTNTPLGKNSYHSGIVSFEKRFSKGWTFNTHYQFTRNLDKDWFPNEFDRLPLWRDSNNTRPHRWVATSIWELPFGKGRTFLNDSGILSSIVGGWQIGAIALIQSGEMLEFGNLIFKGSDYSQIKLSGDERTPNRWFNTDRSLWETSSNNTLLTFHRRIFPSRFNWLRAPTRKELDMNFQREFVLKENLKIRARLDLINVLNHQGWGTPGLDPTNPTDFGRITSSLVIPRQIQLHMRFVF